LTNTNSSPLLRCSLNYYAYKRLTEKAISSATGKWTVILAQKIPVCMPSEELLHLPVPVSLPAMHLCCSGKVLASLGALGGTDTENFL